MNQYTADFHAADFPGYRPTGVWSWDPETFWYRTDIPWVELPIKFDTHHSAKILEQEHHVLFDEIAEQQNRRLHNQSQGRSWFATEHQKGWQQCAILRDHYPALAAQISGTQMPAEVVRPRLHPEVCQDIRERMRELGIRLHWADVKALAPGGWIQPHRDPKVQGTTTMEYFWMPLNPCAANLKFWPAGYLQHRCGYIYLVNNQTWLHSVINTDSWTRYVLVGRIDRHSLNAELLHMTNCSVKQQWFDQ
jgi:hypothetical protein